MKKEKKKTDWKARYEAMKQRAKAAREKVEKGIVVAEKEAKEWADIIGPKGEDPLGIKTMFEPAEPKKLKAKRVKEREELFGF